MVGGVEAEVAKGTVGVGEGDEGFLIRGVEEQVDCVGESAVDLPVEPRSQEVVLVFLAQIVWTDRVEDPARLLGAGL